MKKKVDKVENYTKKLNESFNEDRALFINISKTIYIVMRSVFTESMVIDKTSLAINRPVSMEN
ncbi:MAG: hypothetical protein ACFE75_03670 [Candidatus Hodarchaeota archaeon]